MDKSKALFQTVENFYNAIKNVMESKELPEDVFFPLFCFSYKSFMEAVNYVLSCSKMPDNCTDIHIVEPNKEN